MDKTRRNLLKLSGLVGVGYLTGCSSLDRWVAGDSRDEGENVVILGAGVAGLYAAYLLGQARIPFRIFEGQSRVGGRIRSLSDFTDSGHSAELGAELFHTGDELSLQLMKDLRISLEGHSGLPNFFLRNQNVSSSVLEQSFKKLQRIFQKLRQEAYVSGMPLLNSKNKEQFPKAQQLDEMSARELLKRIRSQIDEVQLEICESWGHFRFGTDLQFLSALAFVEEASRGLQREWHRVPGGMQLLPQSLHDRVAGVVPGRFVKLEHRLKSIEKVQENYRLLFQTPKTEIEVTAKNVICTLPVQVTAKLKGLDQLSLNETQRNYILKTSQAQISKLVVSQPEQYWRKDLRLAPFQWLERDVVSISSPWQISSMARPKNILSVSYSGQRGLEGGPHLIDTTKTIVGAAWNIKNMAYDNSWYIQNWSRLPSALGGGSFLSPGQAQVREELLALEEAKTKWVFAGEAFSLIAQGRIEGALLSGREAAQWFIKKLKV